MRTTYPHLISLVAIVLLCATTTHAADLPLGTAFTYQGDLHQGGAAANGDYDFEFSLWDDSAAGTQVGVTINAAAVQVVDGTFTVDLDFGFGVFTGSARWLEVAVRPTGGGGYTTLNPRQPLTATPYAQAIRLPFYGTQEQNGASFGITNPHPSGTAGWFYTSDPANDQEAVKGITDGNGAGVRGENTAFGRGVSGSGFYGVYGETPTNAGYGVYARNNNGNMAYLGDDNRAGYAYNANSGYYTILGDNSYAFRASAGGTATRTGSGVIGNSDDQFGVYGTTNSKVGVMGHVLGNGLIYLYDESGVNGYSPTGFGTAGVTESGTAVIGWQNDTENNGRLGMTEYGVYGRALSGTGVHGRTADTSSNAFGVHGLVNTTSPGSYSAGVRAENRGTGGLGIGVWGSHAGSGWGVLGESPSGVGVYGSSASGYAGYFGGDVTVTGSLAKGGGSFKIDHPVDPENKFLYHSFVESPDMMNIYNGNITTDKEGLAWVEMPEWFQPLNRDFRYQLTTIGQFAQAIVAEKMKDGRFLIQTDQPGVEVSWQVTGIRQDAWAEANRIPVEQDKTVEQRGRFLHPEAFGLDAEHGLDRRPAEMRGTAQPVDSPRPTAETVEVEEAEVTIE